MSMSTAFVSPAWTALPFDPVRAERDRVDWRVLMDRGRPYHWPTPMLCTYWYTGCSTEPTDAVVTCEDWDGRALGQLVTRCVAVHQPKREAWLAWAAR